MIVISISSCLVNHGLDISGSAIPTTVITTPKKLFAGANRNIAAAEAVKQGATHLSFFDADDLMHPQRLECIEHAFNTTPDLTGLIHSYLVAQKKDMAIYKGEKEIPWEPILKDFAPNVFQAGQYNKINIIKFQQSYKRPRKGYGMGQNGHLTVLASFWEANPYVDDLARGQDSHFSCSILHQKKMLGYTGDILSVYMRNDAKGF